jgi:hypothetical protein
MHTRTDTQHSHDVPRKETNKNNGGRRNREIQGCQNRVDTLHGHSQASCRPAVRARSVSLGAAGLLAAWGLVGEEHDALHLPDVVESEDADVVVGIGLLGLLKLGVHLGGVGAAEHGQLPHGPVAAIVVPGRSGVLTEDEADLAELEAGDPVVPDQVVDLLQEVLRGERRQVRQGLELLVVLSRPHLNNDAPIPSVS